VNRGWHSLAVFSLLITMISGVGGDAADQRFEFSQPHMGTTFRIILYASNSSTATRTSSAAFRRIAALDNTMSDYQSGSELMALCRHAGGPPVAVSEDLFRVLEKSQELARRTHGAFDITCGPVVRLWRRARRRSELPDAQELAEARKLVGYQYLRLDSRPRTAQLKKRGMLLDLGGIAKGYAADQALAVLKKQGIASALVAAGGDIAVGAPPPREEGWRIGIEQLESPAKPPKRFLMLHDQGVSTSGDSEQYVEIGGKRYSHIIDPRTGMALTGRSSVTTIADDATTSDATATALSVLGPDEGLAFVKSIMDLSVFFVQATPHGNQTYVWGLLPFVAPAASGGGTIQ